jgi:single-strand DNA-binding protein
MARGFNKAIIIGNLARDPEIRYTASGTAVARLVVAVNRQWRGQNGEAHEEVDFIPAVVWGSQAENCDRYLRKGRPVLVEGRISVRSYEGRDGQKRYATEIVAQTVQFLGSGGGEGGRRDDDSSGSLREGGGDARENFRETRPQPQQKRQPQEGAKSLREGGFADDFPLDFSEVGDGDVPGGGGEEDEDIPF